MRRFLKLHTAIKMNPKVLGLSTDADRWHYVLILVAAKEATPEGEWLNEDYLRAAVSPATYRRLQRFLEGRLLVRDTDGRIAVPNYDDWQASDRELPKGRRDADTNERIHQQWAAASRRYRGKRTAPPSYDASSQTSKKVSNERHDDGSATGADGAPTPTPSNCPHCGDPVDGSIFRHIAACDAASRSTTLAPGRTDGVSGGEAD